MANRLNFTKRFIEGLPLPEQGRRIEYFDEQIKALVLRVTDKGVKTFYVRKKIDGISKRFLIGQFPDLTIDQARKKAAEYCGSLALGEDLQAKRKRSREELPLGILLARYIEDHAQQHCLAGKEIEAVFRRYLSDWSDRKLSSIKKLDVNSKLAAIATNHGQFAANHTLTYARAAINWCIERGLTTLPNPWTGAQKFKVLSRERFIRPEELKRFFECLDKISNHGIRDYILVSLFTGARRSNVLAMRWDQIDFTLGTWKIPRTKSGDSHTLPLTSTVLELLQLRQEARTNEWVFPSKGKTGHLVEPKKSWQSLLRLAELDDLRLHDLRRTLGSYMAIGNQSLQVIGKVLGHKSSQATQIYSKLTYDPLRQAMEKAQSDMFKVAGLMESKGL
jgi:integrase